MGWRHRVASDSKVLLLEEHEVRRHAGAIGACEFPGKVFKGRKMPGQMGDWRVTTQNLKGGEVDAGENLLLLRGSVPGARGALVIIRKAVKRNGLPRA